MTDLVALAVTIKAWGRELGFADIRITTSTCRTARPDFKPGSTRAITVRWIIWQATA